MPKGVVLLLSVLVVGSVVLAMALAVSLGSVGRTTTALHASKALEVRLRTAGCVDEALIWLGADAAWTETSVATSEGTCAVSVVNLGGNAREVTVSANEENVFYGLKASVTVDPLVVTSMEEVLP